MKLLVLIICLWSVSLMAMAGIKIFKPTTQSFITQQQFIQELPNSGQIVMGEFHYHGPIQEAQGDIIRALVKDRKLQGDFTVAWEFLNYTDKLLIKNSVNQYNGNYISEEQLLKGLFPHSGRPEQNRPYLAFLRAAKELKGQVIGVNSPRKIKSIITKNGLSALDPKYIPPNMELGTTNYRQRFVNIMGGHVPAEQLQNYFEAQSFTDSVMAYHMLDQAKHNLRFLIVGAFHSNYSDGVVDQISKLSAEPTINIKIVDENDLSPEEVESLYKWDPKYGFYADYIYMIEKTAN